MATAVQLITENLGIWASAVQTKPAAGRGKANKLELYGIKKLRELILELAVRGLLVPQDLNDEPASELLKKIAAEKAQLVKDGKIKKQKALPAIEDDEKAFELPEGWEWERFGAVYWLEYGDNLPKAKRSETGEYPVYGSNGVVGTHDDFCVESPCIVVGRKGSAGALNLCLDEKCWVTDVAYSLIPPACMFTEFVFRQLHTLNLDSLGKGIKPGLSRNEAYVLPVAIPPAEEQARIVAKVDELMALCDQLEQQQDASITAHQTLVQTLLDALTTASERDGFTVAWARIANHFDTLFTAEWSIDQLKQTILNLAVHGKLAEQDPNDEPASNLLKSIEAQRLHYSKAHKFRARDPEPVDEDSVPFFLPANWEWCRLGRLCNAITDGDHLPPPKSDDGIAFLTIGNITTGKLDFERSRFVPESYYHNLAHFRRPIQNDILYTVVGATYGRPALVSTSRQFCVQRHIAILKPPGNGVEIAFIMALLRSPLIYQQATASTTGTAQPTIPLGSLRNFLVPLAPLAEQKRIVKKVDSLMALCDTLKTRLNTAQTTQLHLADAVAVAGLGE